MKSSISLIFLALLPSAHLAAQSGQVPLSFEDVAQLASVQSPDSVVMKDLAPNRYCFAALDARGESIIMAGVQRRDPEAPRPVVIFEWIRRHPCHAPDIVNARSARNGFFVGAYTFVPLNHGVYDAWGVGAQIGSGLRSDVSAVLDIRIANRTKAILDGSESERAAIMEVEGKLRYAVIQTGTRWKPFVEGGGLYQHMNLNSSISGETVYRSFGLSSGLGVAYQANSSLSVDASYRAQFFRFMDATFDGESFDPSEDIRHVSIVTVGLSLNP
jgi:opacity protein-like surface antigen